jgi:hypothetical protein
MTFDGTMGVLMTFFGTAIEYAPLNGAPGNLQGIFDMQFRRLAADTRQPGIASVGPAVFVRLSDLPVDPVMGAPVDPTTDNPVITVDGIEYRVREVQKDGQGGAVLHLTKKA